MKKVFYVDSAFLLIGTVLFAIYAKNFSNPADVIKGVIFIISAAFVESRFFYVTQYPVSNKTNALIIAEIFVMILGKIQLILMTIRLGYLVEEPSFAFFAMPIFILNTLLFLEYAYFSKDRIIILGRKPVLISEIKEYIITEATLGFVYMNVWLENQEKKIRIRLSKEDYDDFLIEYKGMKYRD